MLDGQDVEQSPQRARVTSKPRPAALATNPAEFCTEEHTGDLDRDRKSALAECVHVRPCVCVSHPHLVVYQVQHGLVGDLWKRQTEQPIRECLHQLHHRTSTWIQLHRWRQVRRSSIVGNLGLKGLSAVVTLATKVTKSLKTCSSSPSKVSWAASSTLSR